MGDPNRNVPEEFRGADSIDEVYTQVYALNMALQQGQAENKPPSESEYQQSVFDSFDGGELFERFEALIGQIRENLESIVGESVESYTISMTGSMPPSVTLDITYNPATDES